jgi:hypothetical protein
LQNLRELIRNAASSDTFRDFQDAFGVAHGTPQGLDTWLTQAKTYFELRRIVKACARLTVLKHGFESLTAKTNAQTGPVSALKTIGIGDVEDLQFEIQQQFGIPCP